jgi:hypothetical protein
MEHLDPDVLALLALGEDAASATGRLHLAGCLPCREEIRRLARPVAAAREIDDEPLTAPGPQVWAGIASALQLDPDVATDPLGGGGPRPLAPPTPPLRRFRRSVVVIAAAAAAVLVLGVVGVGLLSARHDAQRLATATLQAFPGWRGSSGTAVLERLPGGRRVVEVTTTVQPDPRTDHEVWLMTAGAKRLVSLGLLHGTSGTFTVPTGVDVGRFRLVDVSDEPRDGNPAHSGDSIVRGALRS